MHADTEQVIERPGDLTAAWLTAAIGAGPVAEFTAERIGTGQMSECYRVRLTYADGALRPDRPESVVLKVAATDPMSRQTGLALGLYEREVCFYGDIAPRLGGPVAPCYHAAVDTSTGVFDLLLGDAGPAVVGDEIAGATTEQARLGVEELGRLHGPLLGDPALAEAPWLNRESPLRQAMITPLYAGFVDRYGDQIEPGHRLVCERLVASFDAYLAQESEPGRIQGLVHGDYRLDNMLFGTEGADRALTVVDWQTVSWGPALTDLAYFLGCALSTRDRRAHYDALLRAYHEALGPDAPVSLADVAEGVRRQSFFGVMMAIVSSMLVERTERGDRMFMTMLQRHCEHVLDTDALATLPDAATPEPLRPSHDDELAHAPTAEPLWSESWYADFADPAQGLGGWFRLGLIANQRQALVHALLCGPEMPTVAVDALVPLPADPWALRTDTLELGHSASAALQTYRVDVRARARAYDDPAALLRGEPGTPVELTMHLVWATDGAPYMYRLTTRYEIPCRVSGTVSVDGTGYRVESVPGQRDHSWGVRDWWSMDWIWSALHLEDGTHLHGVNIRIPGAPAFSVGYVQDADHHLTEVQTLDARETFGANGLPRDATLAFDPGGIAADIAVRGQAPVRLVSPDGRVSQFPRAWVTVTTTDGRRGVGWVEWNRNLATG
ncbi:phosphotransferase [Mycobacterium helveticum]|uniref:Phosphotransferase n=1 Tax=Mycobacterium helveticum TaxID=2592811 RepID=A0A557XJJ7_9MYCO|nr:phosphotransferase [Mycobacterium helveticum]TVS85522.1 phosphotransferase [Mycobacterium helveticum]TVS85930.1 phosphotransferase [Mycobacterium helveticum]